MLTPLQGMSVHRSLGRQRETFFCWPGINFRMKPLFWAPSGAGITYASEPQLDTGHGLVDPGPMAARLPTT